MSRKLILIFKALLLVVLCHSVLGCSPGYVIRAIYEEGKILGRRQKIEKVIANPATPPDQREKLKLVLAAREYGLQIGLTPKDSFTKYSKVDKDILAWILAASRPDAFFLKTWWFPVVGTVPYRGFFEKKDAEQDALKLRSSGYETWIRGTEAFSTLGWFADPVLSTTLKNHPVRVVNTVLHESVHSTVWIPGSVEFNESAANFVGLQGALNFFESAKDQANFALAQGEKNREFEFASVVSDLYQALEKLYAKNISKEEKLKARTVIFNQKVAPLRAKYPNMRILNEVNNAEIIQLKIYMTELPTFEAVYQQLGRDWPKFITHLAQVAKSMEEDGTRNPFLLLKEGVSK